MLSFSTYSQLDEKLILYNNGAKYGQVVFLAGGAGSGKGFALQNFMEKDKFKIIDVDELKASFLRLAQLKEKYAELRGLDLRNPKDVFFLHNWIKRHQVKDKLLYTFIDSQVRNSGHLPNIMFDTTFKDLGDIYQFVPPLLRLGYQPEDIHITWVLVNYEVAVERNRNRDRVVPDDIVLRTHEGAALTMHRILTRGLPRGVNGEVRIVLTNPGTTTMYTKEEVVLDEALVKDFLYILIKKAGQPMMKSAEVMQKVYRLITDNVPKTFMTKHIWRSKHADANKQDKQEKVAT